MFDRACDGMGHGDESNVRRVTPALTLSLGQTLTDAWGSGFGVILAL